LNSQVELADFTVGLSHLHGICNCWTNNIPHKYTLNLLLNSVHIIGIIETCYGTSDRATKEAFLKQCNLTVNINKLCASLVSSILYFDAP